MAWVEPPFLPYQHYNRIQKMPKGAQGKGSPTLIVASGNARTASRALTAGRLSMDQGWWDEDLRIGFYRAVVERRDVPRMNSSKLSGVTRL